jgi:hypothetical protein
MCEGTPGQWDGCRGTGCSVCAEKLTGFSRYFTNHPGCAKNDTCAGQFFTCNAACPAPTDADKDPPPVCAGTPGQWDGCRGTGCSVCAEKLTGFSRYFTNHPGCAKNDTCAGQFFTCNAACPAPTDADKDPPPVCAGTPGQWDGCRGTGCSVCSEKLTGFSRYFANHPGCAKNDTCAGLFFTCNAACPAPTNADKDPAVTLSFEAEAGALTSPMVVLADATASAGKVIWSGTSNSTTAPATTGHATFTFNVATGALFKVWGRFLVGPLTTSDDSLWVRMDAGAWTQWNDIFQRVGNAGYAWDSVHDTGAANAEVMYNLSAGAHQLEVAYRENGLKMDRFLVTNDLVLKP